MSLIFEIKVFGRASQNVVKLIEIDELSLEFTLMDLLRAHQIPIASSCLGEGICQKCVVFTSNNQPILSCFISVGQYIQKHGLEITVSYL